MQLLGSLVLSAVVSQSAAMNTWGLNVERTIRRLNEVDRWASPRREVCLTNLTMAGRLTDLEDVRQGRGLD